MSQLSASKVLGGMEDDVYRPTTTTMPTRNVLDSFKLFVASDPVSGEEIAEKETFLQIGPITYIKTKNNYSQFCFCSYYFVT